MRAVNLLPSDAVRTRRPVNRVALAGVAGASAVSMLLGAVYLDAHSNVAAHEAELAALQKELAETPKPVVKPSANQQLAAERAARVAALTSALRLRVGWDRIFGELSSVLPADVWLTNLDAKGPSPVASVSTDGPTAPVSIQGYTYSQEGVARLLARLQVVPDFSAVELQSSALTEVAGQDVYQFTIQAQVRGNGATS
jgi:Tfp pilus assembly protein PilN